MKNKIENFRRSSHFLFFGVILILCLIQLGCPKQKMPEECEYFYKSLTSNQREVVFKTYDLEKQLRLHRCGLEKIPMDTSQSIGIANRGKDIVPILLNKLSVEKDEVTKYGIILIFESMFAAGILKDDEMVINNIKKAISEMKTDFARNYSQRSLTRIQEFNQK